MTETNFLDSGQITYRVTGISGGNVSVDASKQTANAGAMLWEVYGYE